MIDIRQLELADSDYVKAIALLHMKAFPDFFLTKLGCSFLCVLYTGYLEDSNSGIIVAEDSEGLVGFIAFSNDYSGFFKGLIKNHLPRFALCSLGAVIRHPTFLRRLLGAFKKSENVVKEEQYVELASICVSPDIENKGIGSRLIDYLKNLVDFNTYSYINLETDADGNDGANYFYIKNGFKLANTYVTAEGRRMNEYRFYGEKQ